MRSKSIIVSVINDISTDQRILRTCSFLSKKGYKITVIGRELPNSLSVPVLPYRFIRMRLLFSKGPFFYAEYNIRLFFHLLSLKKTHLLSNDLDTLLPNFLIKLIAPNVELVYDSHEYFTGVPELTARPMVQKVWKSIEKLIIPKLGKMITVNDSIAQLYQKEYGVSVDFVRNIGNYEDFPKVDSATKEDIIILQGAGINIDRGGEEAVLAMQFIDNAQLYIVGSGDAIPLLKEMTHTHQLSDKITFIDKLPYHELLKYTAKAKVGLSLDKNTNVNYKFSLPNKIFDYIHSNTAVVASDLVEVKKVVEGYDVGEITPSYDPKVIADTILSVLVKQNKGFYNEKFLKAQNELNWASESEKLVNYFE